METNTTTPTGHNTPIAPAYNLVGETVRFRYIDGNEYVGTVTPNTRFHTINFDTIIMFIEFDEPTEVMGRVRDAVCVELSLSAHTGTYGEAVLEVL